MPAQGDVLFYRIEKEVATSTGLKAVGRDRQDRIVLAWGETSGHAHAVLDKDVELFAPGEAAAVVERYLRVGAAGATLQHVQGYDTPTGEHGPHELEEGWYAVRNQREFYLSEIRDVID